MADGDWLPLGRAPAPSARVPGSPGALTARQDRAVVDGCWAQSHLRNGSKRSNMRAMRYTGERLAVCDERETPRPAPNEVLIQMKAAGICGSDLHIYRHPDARFVDSARVPGHEPAGV